jgi:hypothetical protein
MLNGTLIYTGALTVSIIVIERYLVSRKAVNSSIGNRSDVTKKDTDNPIRKAVNLSIGDLDKLFNIGGESGRVGPLCKVMDFIPTASLGGFAKASQRANHVAEQEIEERRPSIESIISVERITILLTKTVSGEVKLYGCGNNEAGQLGLGDRDKIKKFEELPINLAEGYHIERVECGWEHAIVTAKNAQGEQKLYGCGSNASGQLGLGDRGKIEHFEELPINLAEGYQLERVECGDSHTIVMTKNAQGEKKLYGCGSNYECELGLGGRSNIQQFEALPITLEAGYRIERVECGNFHTIVTARGSQGEQKLYGCGLNVDGQLGLGGRRNIQQFEALPINMAEGYQIERVECGFERTIVTAKNSQGEQKLYGCGQNHYGQLGMGGRRNIKHFEALPINLAEGYQIERVECGWQHTIVMAKNVKGDMKLYGCGSNEKGQLGLGGRRNIQQFEALPINLAEGYQIERVECGWQHTIVMAKNVKGDMKLYGCGSNSSGQLDLGDRKDIKQFEEIPVREQILRSLVEKERGEEHSYNL